MGHSDEISHWATTCSGPHGVQRGCGSDTSREYIRTCIMPDSTNESSHTVGCARGKHLVDGHETYMYWACQAHLGTSEAHCKSPHLPYKKVYTTRIRRQRNEYDQATSRDAQCHAGAATECEEGPLPRARTRERKGLVQASAGGESGGPAVRLSGTVCLRHARGCFLLWKVYVTTDLPRRLRARGLHQKTDDDGSIGARPVRQAT